MFPCAVSREAPNRTPVEPRFHRFGGLLLALLAVVVLGGCATAGQRPAAAASHGSATAPDSGFMLASFEGDWDDDFLFGDDLEESAVRVRDPLEGFNRAMFDFNGLVYEALVIPVSRVYTVVTPESFRRAVRNFFGNLRAPISVVNHALQGDFENSGLVLQKFALNSTVGVLGFGRPSEAYPRLAEAPATDLGLTFARWGLRETPYLVLPLLGPSTVGDAVGSFGDRFFYPPTYILDTEDSILLAAGEATNRSRELMREFRALTATSVDPYAAMRDGYLQFRRARLRGEAREETASAPPVGPGMPPTH